MDDKDKERQLIRQKNRNTDQCCVSLLPQSLSALQHLHHQLGHLEGWHWIMMDNLRIIFLPWQHHHFWPFNRQEKAGDLTCRGLESTRLVPRSLLKLVIPSKLRPTFTFRSLFILFASVEYRGVLSSETSKEVEKTYQLPHLCILSHGHFLSQQWGNCRQNCELCKYINALQFLVQWIDNDEIDDLNTCFWLSQSCFSTEVTSPTTKLTLSETCSINIWLQGTGQQWNLHEKSHVYLASPR